MKKRNLLLACGILGALTMGQNLNAAGYVDFAWNPDRVVLPSSQWTPDQPYEALVWIFNTGERYNDNYNYIWATPANDENGNPWYAYDYTPTPAQDIEWEVKSAPFSSDEWYKGHKSTQWVTGDIMGEIYMRRSFTINGPLKSRLYLACGRDDAPSEWYINGVLVHSETDGWNNDARLLLTEDQQALIKTDGSENILAVHVHQNWGGAFADCGLYYGDGTFINKYLDTKDGGAWNCAYKLQDSLSDEDKSDNPAWAAADLDESDWNIGEGPFSNSDDQFKHTYWNSNDHPILIRRHVTLTAADIEQMAEGNVIVSCSFDEYPRVYVNGTKVCSWDGWNDGNYANYTLSAAQKGLFREGDNVVAVSLQKGGGGGHIDYGVRFEALYVSPAEIDEFRETLADVIEQATGKFSFYGTTALMNEIDKAKDVYANATTATAIKDATDALRRVLDQVNRAGTPMWNYMLTINRGLMEGVDYSAADAAWNSALTEGQFNDALRDLRYARRRAAADKHEDLFEGAAPAEGNFYIYNLGQKQFLCGGSDWGAHAALGFPGVEVTLIAKNAADNQYWINTHLNNGVDSEYMNYRGYMDCGRPDGAWYFEPVPGKTNVYYIKQGDYKDVHVAWNPYASVDGGARDETNVGTEERNLNPNDLNAQWKLVTREERDALLEGAKLLVPRDVTYKIKSPNFNQRERANDVWARQNANVWKYGSCRSDFIMESWNSGNCNISQTVTDLPAGVYRVTVQGFYRNGHHDNQANLPQDRNAYLYAGTDAAPEVALPNICSESYNAPGEGDNARIADGGIDEATGEDHYQIPNSGDQAANYFKSGLYKTSTVVEVGENGELTFGVRKDVKGADGDWVVVDNFRLTYYGNKTTVDKVSGIEEVEAAEDAVAPVYYNLQGQRVNNPANGLFIKVNGNKVTKVIL